jgi:hypothetical protein
MNSSFSRGSFPGIIPTTLTHYLEGHCQSHKEKKCCFMHDYIEFQE